jgi:hypothetical protein
LRQQSPAVQAIRTAVIQRVELDVPASGPQSGDTARKAADFLQNIKESTPALMQQLRQMPLIQWDQSLIGSPINVSVSEVAN